MAPHSSTLAWKIPQTEEPARLQSMGVAKSRTRLSDFPVFVETPSYSLMSDDDRKRLRSNMNLAEKLGARLETVTGDNVPYQIAEYARVSDVSTVVIGQPNTVGTLLRRRKSLTDRLVAYARISIILSFRTTVQKYIWPGNRLSGPGRPSSGISRSSWLP